MLKNIDVVELLNADDIIPAYTTAINNIGRKSTILVEFADLCK